MSEPTQGPVTDRRQPIDLQDEIQKSYLDYAMSVIVGRALPDVRDGLKPVHRRILYAMYDGGYRPDRGWNKCARVVGEVMGQYHPHGDSAIYDTLVRLAQPWVMRYPLVAGQGNFGSPGNDPAAAMRYTECKMAPMAMEMVRDINENTVDFKPNYDGKESEPVVLPVAVPQPAGQRLDRNRCRDGHQHPPAQPARSRRSRPVVAGAPRGQRRGAAGGVDGTGQGTRLPQRGPDRGSAGDRGGLPHRPWVGDDAGGGQRRGGQVRPGVTGGHRAAAHGQPGQPVPEDRRAGQLRPAQRDLRHPRQHLHPDRAAAGHRVEARRPAAGRAEQPLQAHPAAGHVRLQHVGVGRRRTPDAAARPVRLVLGGPTRSRSSSAAPSTGSTTPRPAPTSTAGWSRLSTRSTR